MKFPHSFIMITVPKNTFISIFSRIKFTVRSYVTFEYQPQLQSESGVLITGVSRGSWTNIFSTSIGVARNFDGGGHEYTKVLNFLLEKDFFKT